MFFEHALFLGIFIQSVLLKSANNCKIWKSSESSERDKDKEFIFSVQIHFLEGLESIETSQYFIFAVVPHKVNGEDYFHCIIFAGISRKRRKSQKNVWVNLTWGLAMYTNGQITLVTNGQITLVWGTYRNL